MPKFKILCFILAAVLAAAGTILVMKNIGGEDIPDFVAPTEDLNVYLDRTDDVNIDDPQADVRQFLFIAHKILLSGKGFSGISDGTSTAVGIQQSVHNSRYVIGEFGNKRVLKEMITKGMVSNAYQLYLDGNDYIYRQPKARGVHSLNDVDWENSAQPLNKEAFFSRFGHRSDKLTGYILNWDTVLSGNFVEKQDGLYTFRYVLDTESATTYLRREMITNGGLSGEPTFTKCEIYVTMDGDFNVKSLRTDCTYKAKTMGITASCSEDITEVFQVYEQDSLPYSDFFEPYLGQDGGDVHTEKTALEQLVEMFTPYLQGQDLKVDVNASYKGESVTDALLCISGLDISDLDKIRVSAKVNDAQIAYTNSDKKIYLKYQDFRAGSSAESIADFAGAFSAMLSGDQAQAASLDLSELADIDPQAILDKLSFTISSDGNTCTANLPISVGDLAINANLYGTLDGETYAFSHAEIAVGELLLQITLRDWQPVDLSEGDYPEILGLADLLADGKLQLNAQLRLPVNDDCYDVNADIVADLANRAVRANATFNDNGTLCVTYIDNSVYVCFGKLKFKADTDNIDGLGDLLSNLANKIDLKLPQISQDGAQADVTRLLGLLGGFAAKQTDLGKVDLILDVADMQVVLHLVDEQNRWHVESITAEGNGVTAAIVARDGLQDVSLPTDADSYADVSTLVDTFAKPIADVLASDGLGAEFALDLTVQGKKYLVKGSFDIDAAGGVHAVATLFDGDVAVLDADVIYVDNAVYLTVNGIKTAFAADDSDADPSEIFKQYLTEEKLKELAESNEQLSKLVQTVGALAQKIKQFDPATLLNVDFSAIVSQFEFKDGEITVALDGGELGLDGTTVSLSLAVTQEGKIAARVGDIEIDGVRAEISVALNAEVQTVTAPDANDYVLNLHGEAMGVEIDLSIDLVHTDIWASVQFAREQALLRIVNGKAYVAYGGAKAVFDVSELGGIADKIAAMLGDGSGEIKLPEGADALKLLSLFGYGLKDGAPSLTFDYEGISARLNFRNDNGKPVFDGITVQWDDNVATLTQQSEQAVKLSTDGRFVNGNELVDKILDTVNTFKDCNSLEIAASADVSFGGKRYAANIRLHINDGIRAEVTLGDKADGMVLLSLEAIAVDGVLYIDVNGIRQATKLSGASTASASEIGLADILGLLDRFEGINDVLDSVIEAVKRVPADWSEIVYSQIISDLYFDQNGALVVQLDLEQFNLGKMQLSLGLGEQLTVGLNGAALGEIGANVSATVTPRAEQVVAPDSDSYTTELIVEIGEIVALVKLDLFKQRADGQLTFLNNTVAFSYESGVVYVQDGNISVQVALADIGTLAGALGQIVNLPEPPQAENENTDVIDIIKHILAQLSAERTSTDGGYKFALSLPDSASVNFDIVSDGTSAKLDEIAIDLHNNIGVITVKLSHDLKFAQVDRSREFADITEVVETFVEPVARLLKGESYGIRYELNVTLDKSYEVEGNFAIDSAKNIQITALVKDGELGIIDLGVIISDGTVYLTVNGVNVAFKMDGSTDIDVEQALDEVLANEQIQSVLNSHSDIKELIEQVGKVIGAVTNLDVKELDIAQPVQTLTFADGTLRMQLNGESLGLGTFELAMGASDGELTVTLNNFELASVKLNSVKATVYTDANKVTVPNREDYILNMRIEGMGVEATISADLYNMDIWAEIRYTNSDVKGIAVNEIAQIRFVENKLYLKLNKINLVFDVAEAKDVIAKVVGLVVANGNGATELDVNKVLSDLVFDLLQSHTIRYETENFGLSVAFGEADGKLTFNNIEAEVGNEQISATLCKEQANKLNTSEGNYINGNKIADKVISAVEQFKDVRTFKATLNGEVTLNGSNYQADVTFNYNNGIYVTLKLYDDKAQLLNAAVTLKGETLYIVANGIEQKVQLPQTSNGGDIDVKTLLGALTELKGLNETVDQVISVIENFGTKLESYSTVSELIGSLTLEGEDIVLALNSSRLGIGDITLTIQTDDGVKVNLDGIDVAGIALNFEATVSESAEEVAEPQGDFVTELNIELGELGDATLKLDLYNKTVQGVAHIYNNKINVLYKDGTIYVTLGDIGIYVETSEIEDLLTALSPFITMPATDTTVKGIAATVMGLLSKVTRTDSAKGYALNIELNGTTVEVTFDGNATFSGLTVATEVMDITATLTSKGSYADVQTNKDQLVNATTLAQVFIPAIDKLLKGESYGARYELNVTLDKSYEVEGNFAIDGAKNIQITALVKDGELGIIDLDVIISDGTVYLTVNGVKVAFKMDGSTDIDVEQALDEVLANEQIQSVLNSHSDIKELIEQVGKVIGAVTNLDVKELDIAQPVQTLTFADGTLRLQLNGESLGLGTFELAMGASDGELTVTLNNFELASVKLNSVKATVVADAVEIDVPKSTDSYILYLNVNGMGVNANIAADLCNMDIRAQIDYAHDPIDGVKIKEQVLVRYFENMLYIKAGTNGQIALEFNVNGLSDAIARFVALLNGQNAAGDVDINALLANLTFDLAGAHSISFNAENLELSVNFEGERTLAFENIVVKAGDMRFTAEIVSPMQLEAIGDGEFADGNKLLTAVADALAIFKDASGVKTALDLALTLDGNAYTAHIDLNYDQGLRADVTLKDGVGKQLVTGYIVVKGGTLYLDINGIKQAVQLDGNDQTGDAFELDDLKTLLEDYVGINDVLDEIIKVISALPDNLRQASTVSDFVKGLSVAENGTVTLVVAATKLGLAADLDVRARVDGNGVTLSFGDIALGDGENTVATVSLTNALLKRSCEQVVAPGSPEEFVTELNLQILLNVKDQDAPAAASLLAEGSQRDYVVEVGLRLDLYNNRIFGWATFLNNKATFEFNTQSGNVYLRLGDDGVRLMFNIHKDIDVVTNALADLGITLPQTDLGGADSVRKLLNGLRYTDNESGYALGLNLDGINVNLGFNVGDKVTLGNVSVSGGEFSISAKQTEIDVNNVGLSDAEQNKDSYVGASALTEALVPGIKALIHAENYSITFNGSVKLGENVYTVNAEALLSPNNGNGALPFDLYVNLDVDYNSHMLLENGKLCIVGNTVYADFGGFKFKIPLKANAQNAKDAGAQPSGFDIDKLKEYNNKYLTQFAEIVGSLMDTDWLAVNFSQMLGLSTQEGALKLDVNGSALKLDENVSATVSSYKVGDNAIGLNLSLGPVSYKDITINVASAAVMATQSTVEAPKDDETHTWTTDIDVTVDDNSGIANVIHISLDLEQMVVYAVITSQAPDEKEAAKLYVKYDINSNKLFISNLGSVNASVNIGNIDRLVNDVQEIVNKIASQQTQLPNLFEGSGDFREILKTLHFTHNDGSHIGVGLKAFGFDVNATIGGNILKATVDMSSVFDGTKLEVDSNTVQRDVHSSYIAAINQSTADESEYVSLDGVLQDLFYGTSGELDDNNGVIFDLVNTNAWRFDFTGNADIVIGGVDSDKKPLDSAYRIVSGSYIAFYFNKADTKFTMQELIGAFGTNPQDGYDMLFTLLNTMQLRAKLDIQQWDKATQNYTEMLYLDIAILRESGGDGPNTAKSRLYISYDTSKDRAGVLNASLGIDSLKDVLQLKDALDKVLDGAISGLVNNIKDMIAEAQNNRPKLQLGMLARLFNSITYDYMSETKDYKSLEIDINGKALFDKLNNITLQVKPFYGSREGDDHSKHVGNGLTVENLIFGYGDVSLSMTNLVVTASPFYGENAQDSVADTRTYDYLDHSVNSYLTGHDKSNFMNFDSIYELLASVTITAGNYEDYTPVDGAPAATEPGRRSFKIEGKVHVSLANVDIPITMYADIDEYGDSYFAVLLARESGFVENIAYADHGGNSYLTFNTKDGTFGVYRDSYDKRCQKCGKVMGLLEGRCLSCWERSENSLESKSVLGEPQYIRSGIAPDKFMANLISGEGYLWELLNFADGIESQIIKAITDPNAKKFGVDYGVEDILDKGDSYNYGNATDNDGNAVANHMQFEIKANLSPISSSLGVLDIKIHHSGNFDNLMEQNKETGKWEYKPDELAKIKLDRLCGKLPIANILTITFDLNHTTPGYGTAAYFNETDHYTRLWGDSAAWTDAHKLN